MNKKPNVKSPSSAAQKLASVTNVSLMALAVAATFSSSALAQSAAVASPASSKTQAAQSVAAEATNALEEIIVTAQRKSESLQHAAIPVDVISPDQLSNAGIVTISSLNAAVPALIVTKAGGSNTSFYVRGVGNFTVNAYSDPAIAFNVDGVYVGRPTSTTGTFYDLARIEVLKGPQGTLYGRNATGGAVNVIPNKPKIGESSGYVGLGYGRFKATDLEAALNAPLGQNSALRISTKIVSGGAFNKDGTNDEKGQALRVQYLQDVNNDLTVRVAADYSHQGGVGPAPTIVGEVSYTPGTVASGSAVPNYTFRASNLDPYSGLHTAAAVAFTKSLTVPGAQVNLAEQSYPYLNNSYWGLNAEAVLDTSLGAFTFIPAYRDANLDILFNGNGFRGGVVAEKDKQNSAELRLQGKRIGAVDWLLGGYYTDEKIDGRYTFSQYQLQVYQNYKTGTKSSAAFGQATLNVSDNTRVVSGLRYSKDKKYFNASGITLVEICTRPPPPAGPGCVGGPTVPVANSLDALAALIAPDVIPTVPGASTSFGTFGNRLLYASLIKPNTDRTSTKPTYRFAVEHDLSSSSLLYASYETGYRGGGFSLSLGHETYDPEFLKAVTLGSKNRFLDNKLQLNLELYSWKYTNQQVSHFGFDTNNNSSLFTENIGRSTIQGFDIDAQWKASSRTLLRGSVQYLKNTLDSFIYIAPRSATTAIPLTGCAVSNGTQGANLTYNIDCSGLPGFNAPKWSSNIGIDHTIEMGGNNLVLTADARYRASRVIGFERLPQMFSGADTTYDLLAKYGPRDERWQVTGYVRNAGNKAVPVLAQVSGAAGNNVNVQYAPPRTYGLRLSARF